MKKFTKTLSTMVAVTLLGCGGGESSDNNIPTVPPTQDDLILDNSYSASPYPQAEASWYELNQYFEGVPKYSGVMGTYTAKHLPVAVSCSLGSWAVYSNNNANVLEINALNMDTGVVNHITTLDHTIDPHQNAAINCINNELVVYVSARNDTFSGYRYVSSDGINWVQTEENDWSYPQIHNLDGEEVVLYTNYTRSETGYVYRTPKSSCNNEPIVNDGKAHYMVSLEADGVIYAIFNDMTEGADSRTNLGFTKSTDGGCSWTVPVYWWEGDRVYLKDLNIVDGKPTALVVIAESHKPEEGSKVLYRISEDEKTRITDINHNYTTGALTEKGKVITPQGSVPYAGGRYGGIPYVNYIRRVLNSEDLVATEGISGQLDSGSWIIKLSK